jgi:hypothetical protein
MKTTKRVLVAGLLAAALLVPIGLSATPAEARPVRPINPNGSHCGYHNPVTGEWEFYLPGDTISVGGVTLVCWSTGWARL